MIISVYFHLNETFNEFYHYCSRTNCVHIVSIQKENEKEDVVFDIYQSSETKIWFHFYWILAV